jgi:hypothetical protein
MQPQENDPTVNAQRQTAQLAALLATDAGKAYVQQQLSDLLKRQQQQQQQQAPAPAPYSCAEHISNDASTSAAMAVEQADESTFSLADLHPRVLSTAIAVSRIAPGSTDRAAGLALLKQELMQHAPLATALARAAAAGNSVALEPAAAEAAAAEAAAASDVQQQQQQAAPAPVSPTAGDGDQPLTVAMAWAMLQKQNQQGQLQRQDSALEGAISLGLMRHDTAQSMQSNQCLRQETADTTGFAGLQQQHSGAAAAAAAVTAANGAAAAATLRGNAANQAQQLIFKHRSATSTALRRHFSNANKSARSEPTGSPAGFAKPQQVFKKQRKKPLMLWSSGSGISQQMPGPKQMQGPALSAPAFEHHAAAEPEYSTLTGSSSGITGSALQALLEAHAQRTAGTAAAAAAAASAPAALGSQASGVDSVLTTLARQEQQLMMLQQQLRQQRQLFSEHRQAASAAAAPVSPPAAAATANAVKALELELLLGNQGMGADMPSASAQAAAAAAAMLAARRDVEMADAYQQQQQQQQVVSAAEQLQQLQQQLQQQHAAQGGAPSDTVSALMSLANILSNKQPQQQQQPAGQAQMGWDTDVVRKLTAALLAAS